jgi:hypothetical protein
MNHGLKLLLISVGTFTAIATVLMLGENEYRKTHPKQYPLELAIGGPILWEPHFTLPYEMEKKRREDEEKYSQDVPWNKPEYRDAPAEKEPEYDTRSEPERN